MNEASPAPSEELGSTTVKGTGVSGGLAIGPAFLLSTEEERIVERDVAPEELPREIRRLEEALIATRGQLHEIQKRVSEVMGQESASIFDAHLLVVDDRALVEEVVRGLHEQGKNVEMVLERVARQYINALSKAEDDYLRERAVDVRDVTRRILHNLAGREISSLEGLETPCILVANDLPPSQVATLNRQKVIGLATDLGSPTSHTAIMARALDIPAVVGLHDISVRVSSGDPVLLDGDKGLVVLRPTGAQREEYQQTFAQRKSIRTEFERTRDLPAQTLDGYHVWLSANIEFPGDAQAVRQHGARGVGLFRSEYLYLSNPALPSEEEQTRAYESVAASLAPDPVIIRTLDLGGDKFVSHVRTPPELNPFMGWRAIRFCLAQPKIFKAQLRALLRASRHRNLKIMYPMVSNVDELLQANAILEECKDELRSAGVEFNPDVEVGVMIEVPSAALTANLIAPHVKFFSLGTNDLVQYTLAVDRVNERIAYLYEPTHPAIIKLIKNTIDVGRAHGIWTGICGEVAGNPIMVPLLIGLGIDELSVTPSQTGLVKSVIRRLRFSQAERLAGEVLRSESGAEVTQWCRNLVQELAPEVLELVG
jgi:phosphotransferase system enzyme I (PtsI)